MPTIARCGEMLAEGQAESVRSIVTAPLATQCLGKETWMCLGLSVHIAANGLSL